MGPPSGPFSYRESEFLYDPRGIGFMELISGNEAIARGVNAASLVAEQLG